MADVFGVVIGFGQWKSVRANGAFGSTNEQGLARVTERDGHRLNIVRRDRHLSHDLLQTIVHIDELPSDVGVPVLRRSP